MATVTKTRVVVAVHAAKREALILFDSNHAYIINIYIQWHFVHSRYDHGRDLRILGVFHL